MQELYKQKAAEWMKPPFDSATQEEVRRLANENPAELQDAFYRTLEFGTGGLRGVLGVGTNRINEYVVGMATQGFANYLLAGKSEGKSEGQSEHKSEGQSKSPKKIAVSYDSRNKSKELALTTALVFAANGFKVFLFPEMRPTPVLSFAVRHLNCAGGVMITASHNPKEYNGYKAYGPHGGQLVEPHDRNVMNEVAKITDISLVKKMSEQEALGKGLLEYILVDDEYLQLVKTLSLAPHNAPKLSALVLLAPLAVIANRTASRETASKLKIVYTPLHGTGSTLVPKALKQWGFDNVHPVKEQMIPDGNFSTVKSPNPEEKSAMEMSIAQAKSLQADLVLATDPDADRVGVAIPDGKGEYILLNGNQTGAVLIYYLLNKWRAACKIKGKEYVVKTIVTTELIKDIALKSGVECYDVLTGFKYIAETILLLEGQKTFIGGGEESYGYLAGDFVRDKDAVIACCLIAEMAADAAQRGETFMDILKALYKEYGFYLEGLLSITKQGISGLQEIQQTMASLRSAPPKEIAGSKVIEVRDYAKGFGDLPPSDVLQFFTENGSKVTVRPSGTEPKIKFYFGVKGAWQDGIPFEQQEAALQARIDTLKHAFGK
ncbi:MAG: phospho-sugar mutase [Bacteroidales bacterium]|jgi:phosphoglucomutase|nr:phospho-sugar mutase [Bacteroidales bacterium]